MSSVPSSSNRALTAQPNMRQKLHEKRWPAVSETFEARCDALPNPPWEGVREGRMRLWKRVRSELLQAVFNQHDLFAGPDSHYSEKLQTLRAQMLERKLVTDETQADQVIESLTALAQIAVKDITPTRKEAALFPPPKPGRTLTGRFAPEPSKAAREEMVQDLLHDNVAKANCQNSIRDAYGKAVEKTIYQSDADTKIVDFCHTYDYESAHESKQVKNYVMEGLLHRNPALASELENAGVPADRWRFKESEDFASDLHDNLEYDNTTPQVKQALLLDSAAILIARVADTFVAEQLESPSNGRDERRKHTVYEMSMRTAEAINLIEEIAKKEISDWQECATLVNAVEQLRNDAIAAINDGLDRYAGHNTGRSGGRSVG